MATDGPLGPRPSGRSLRARLIVGCIVAVGGGILTLVALQSDWHRTICPGTATGVPGGSGTVRVGERISGYSGVDVAAWLYPLAVLTTALPAISLVLDRRPRAALLAVAAITALTLMIGVFAAPGYTAVSPGELQVGAVCSEVDTAWRNLAFLGAVVALGGVALATKPATLLPKLGLPEQPPSEVEP